MNSNIDISFLPDEAQKQIVNYVNFIANEYKTKQVEFYQDKQQRINKLKSLASKVDFPCIEEPVKWQIDTRIDKQLPNRN